MKVLCIIFILIVNIAYSQPIKIDKYISVFDGSRYYFGYHLYLSESNRFLLYGRGSGSDAIEPTTIYYGTYSEKQDSLYFISYPKDSLFIYYFAPDIYEILFCNDTITISDTFVSISNDIKEFKSNRKENCIIFDSKDLRNNVFYRDLGSVDYSFCIKGILPEYFSEFVNSIEFSLEKFHDDLSIVHFKDDYKRDYKRTYEGRNRFNKYHQQSLDSFSISFNDLGENAKLFFYLDKIPEHLYDRLLPVEIDINKLSKDKINNVFFDCVNGNKIRWEEIIKNSYYYKNQRPQEGDCLDPMINGIRVNVDKQQERLKKKLLNQKEISYQQAYLRLISSSFFDNKRIDFVSNDSLPANPNDVFELINIVDHARLYDIYNSYYTSKDSVINSKKIQKRFNKKKNKSIYYISPAGFNKDKTICFISCRAKNSDNPSEILVFEKRLHEYILTGKITNGIYADELIGNKCEYFEDMRNRRLFY